MSGWPEYVDAVEAAATALREQVLTGAHARTPLIAQPEGPAPQALGERRQAVAALVAEVEALVSRQQAVITRRLAGLPRPAGPQDTATQLAAGGSLDVLG